MPDSVQDVFSCLAIFHSFILKSQYRLVLEYLMLKVGFIFPSIQNRRQKVINRGLYVCAGRLCVRTGRA